MVGVMFPFWQYVSNTTGGVCVRPTLVDRETRCLGFWEGLGDKQTLSKMTTTMPGCAGITSHAWNPNGVMHRGVMPHAILRHHPRLIQQARPLLLRAEATDAPTIRQTPISDLKDQLLRTLCSADRGLAADQALATRVTQLCTALESAGGPVTLTWDAPDSGSTASGLAVLNGTWRLVYSSGFVDGSLGGSRPGPPSVVAPFILGQVYQVVASYTGRLDNVVDLAFKAGLPPGLLPGVSGTPPLVTASLRHTFSIEGTATVRIVFETTEVQARGGFNDVLNGLPSVVLPQLPEALRPPAHVRSAAFDVTYLDGDLRITRGDRGELRVYLRP